MNGSERTGRDGRLLALVIVVSLAVLLVLAKFRFPLAAGVTTAPPAPGMLERLAARSTYDDLAATIANLFQQLTPKIAVAHLGLVPPEEKPGGKKGATPEPIRATWRGGSVPLRRRIVARSSPSTSSMTMYGPLGSSP